MSWLITVIVEETAAVIWGGRSLREILTVLWINTVTNPAAVGLRLVTARNFPEQWMRTAAVAVIEIAVVLTEWRMFRRFMVRRRNYFLFAVVLNAASYGAGLLLPVIMNWIR